MKLKALLGLVPTQNELRANFRILILLRWGTALGTLLIALVSQHIPQTEFDAAPVWITGGVLVVFNSLMWLLVFRTRLSLVLPAYLQVAFDLVTLTALFHYTGGVESPYLAYYVLHLFGTALLLSGAASVFLVVVATAIMGGIAVLEYRGTVDHVALWGTVDLYRSRWYVGTLLAVYPLVSLLLFALGIGVASYLRRQRLRAVAVFEAARTITSTLDVNEVLDHFLESCTTALGATTGSVRLLTPDGASLQMVALHGSPRTISEHTDIRLTDSPLDQQILQGEIVIVNDIRKDPRIRYRTSALPSNLLSAIMLPIPRPDGHPLGVIHIYASSPKFFSASDVPFITSMTAQAGIALSNALRFQTLSEIDEAESRFVQTVTHELRSPVAGAQSLMRNLTQGYVGELSEQQLDILKRIENRLDFLQDLVTDLLDLAAGKEIPFASQAQMPLDMTECLRRAYLALQDQAQAKSITVETNADMLPALWIRASAEDTRRILTNLIGNAIKYTPEHGRVTANLSWDDTWLELTVSDTGIGIPEDDLKHLFEEFFRAKNARQWERQGTGLGLAISKRLVENLEGQIHVTSVQDEGTQFIVNLPLLSVGDQPDSAMF
jgi:signal transduction histidine kinase